MHIRGLRNIMHELLFFSIALLSWIILFFSFSKTRWIDLPNWPTLRSRQIDPPQRPAILVRRKESPLWSAEMSCHSCQPNRSARVTPAQNSQAGHGPLAALPPPPPPAPCDGEGGGERVGASQACQSIPNRYFYFHSLYMAANACALYMQFFLHLQYRGYSIIVEVY